LAAFFVSAKSNLGSGSELSCEVEVVTSEVARDAAL
jgi:hypothetical protein